jgi:FdhD protein
MLSVTKETIVKRTSGGLAIEDDLLAVEEPLEIRIARQGDSQHKCLSITMRTPGDDFELALGFLFTEGILKNIGDVKNIKYCGSGQNSNIVKVEISPEIFIDEEKLKRNFYTTSSCGVCGKSSLKALEFQSDFNDIRSSVYVDIQILLDLPRKLRELQSSFLKTGGIHGCGLFDSTGSVILVKEDVGRHNALDKIIGNQFLTSKLPLSESLLLFSGRLSFELMQKAIMAGSRFVLSVGAPSSLAVDVAEKFDVTVVGFLKNKGFNIYNGAHRIQ